MALVENMKRFFHAALAVIRKALSQPWLYLIVLYTVSFFPLLMNDGLYWDDWVTWNQSFQTLVQLSRNVGIFWTGPWDYLVLSLPFGVFVMRLIVFLCFLFAALFTDKILKTVKSINSEDRFFLILVFALFPVNLARAAICVNQYAVCYFLFYLGFWMLARFLENRNLFLRFAALPVLFFSFFTNSILFFYGLVLLYVIVMERSHYVSAGAFFKRMARYADLFLLPVVFWVLRLLFFKPAGVYAQTGYNTIQFSNILHAPAGFITSMNQSFFDVFRRFLDIPLLGVFLGGFVIFLILKNRSQFIYSPVKDLALFLSGLFFSFIALFPYLAVGQIPDLWSVQSRHQLLMPLGIAFTLYYGLKLFFGQLPFNRRLVLLLHAVLIVFFTAVNFSTGVRYLEETYFKMSVMECLRKDEVVKNNTTFVIDNRLKRLVVWGSFSFYEINGWFRQVFGNDTRLGIDLSAHTLKSIMDYEKWKDIPHYNMYHYNMKLPVYKITITGGPYELNEGRALELAFLRIFHPAEFLGKIRDIARIETAPYEIK